MSTPFLIDATAKQKLHRLRQLAELNPIARETYDDVVSGEMTQEEFTAIMANFTVTLPFNYTVTFTIEDHPNYGQSRHMSMASPVSGRVPIPPAMEMVMDELGFKKSFNQCYTWVEDVTPEKHAVNVLEKIE